MNVNACKLQFYLLPVQEVCIRMQVRVALLQEYFRIRLFSLLQLMAYCLLENVSTDEKQNKMYVINTVNATCEIYMLAKCQQIDDWFSEN